MRNKWHDSTNTRGTLHVQPSKGPGQKAYLAIAGSKHNSECLHLTAEQAREVGRYLTALGTGGTEEPEAQESANVGYTGEAIAQKIGILRDEIDQYYRALCLAQDSRTDQPHVVILLRYAHDAKATELREALEAKYKGWEV